MNLISEITAFAISLAVNMFLIGLLICVGIAAGFRLIPNVAPRARYVISVIAFLIAVVVPLLTTLSGSSKQITLIKNVVQTEQKIPRETDFLINTNINEEFLQNKPDEATSSQSGLLENFVVLASDSLRGEIFLVLWLVISILFLIREMNGHLKLAKAQKNWQRATEAERRETLCLSNINLYFDQKETPCTVGLLHPVIVIPRNFFNDLSATTIRSVIRHETAHVKWRDPLANFLLRLVRFLFWTNPALWFLEHIAKSEQEAAADHEALKLFSRSTDMSKETIEYAMLLLSIAKLSRRKNITAVHLGSSSSLENRIHRILIGYSETSRLRILLSVIIFLTIVSAMAFIPVASKPLKASDIEVAENDLSEQTVLNIAYLVGQNSAMDLQKNLDNTNEKTSRVEQFLTDSEGKSKINGKADNPANMNRAGTISTTSYSARRAEKTSGEVKQETKANDFVYSGSLKYKYDESNINNNVIKPDIQLNYKQNNKFNFQADK